jgi:predicted nucleotide-binding protein (sugar kinase/HSP70/actin superfamily)
VNTEIRKDVGLASLTENVGKFHLGRQTVLIPEMHRFGAHLFAAAMKGLGLAAQVLPTFGGMDLGREYTSGKECYPCQVTLGDILDYMRKERETRGCDFDPSQYVYFLPRSEGPCRFGLYSNYQRMVLDTFPGLKDLRIISLTTTDGYSLGGMLDEGKTLNLRKAGYLSMVVADILDRLLWRVRPYEKAAGMTDAFIERSMHSMEAAFETYAPKKAFQKILHRLREIVEEGKRIIDPTISRKPMVGIVGEIFLRMHVHANQNLIRVLERHGAEVVNASLAEWVNYVSYDGMREAKQRFVLALKQRNLSSMTRYLKQTIQMGGDFLYQSFRQRQAYRRVHPVLDLAEDHDIRHLEKILQETGHFSFDVTTETCLSVASILQYGRVGFDGIVNIYPLTCMPGMATSAVVKPLMAKWRIPHLDAPCDGTFQPGREAAVRTFMYQAHQHADRKGNGSAHHGQGHLFS